MTDNVLKKTISIIGQSIGISATNLPEQSLSKLGFKMEEFLIIIINEARNLSQHKKRQTLCVSDINDTLQIYKYQPLFGYSNKEPKLEKIEGKEIYVYAEPLIEANPKQTLKEEELLYPIATYFQADWIMLNGKNVEDIKLVSEAIKEQDISTSILQSTKIRSDSDSLISTTKYNISNESKYFFSISVAKLSSSNSRDRSNHYLILSSKNFIKVLIPSYIHHAIFQLREHPDNYENLCTVSLFCQAICCNPSISNSVMKYGQDFMTIAYSLLLSQKICPKTLSQMYIQRQLSAEFLGSILRAARYSFIKNESSYNSCLDSYYPMLSNVSARKFIPELTSDAPLFIKYSILVALSRYEISIFRDIVCQFIPEILTEIENVPPDSIEREVAGQMYNLIVNMAGNCLHSDTAYFSAMGRGPLALLTGNGDYRKMMDLFGVDLLPYVITEDCFDFI